MNKDEIIRELGLNCVSGIVRFRDGGKESEVAGLWMLSAPYMRKLCMSGSLDIKLDDMVYLVCNEVTITSHDIDEYWTNGRSSERTQELLKKTPAQVGTIEVSIF